MKVWSCKQTHVYLSMHVTLPHHYCHFHAECVQEHCSCVALFIPGNIHVDVNGRSGTLCGSCQGVCHKATSLHY